MQDKIILLVEDNPDVVDLTLRAFKKSNIANEIIVKKDGAEALDFLFKTGPDSDLAKGLLPQLVLLDLHLPKVDGLEVLRQIRSDQRTKFLPVVILTSSLEEEHMVQSYQLGANSFIRKPVKYDQFITAVQQLGMYWLLLNEVPNNL